TVVAPGANVVVGQEIEPALASVTVSPVTVTVPVFLTVNDQVILSPRLVLPSALTSVTAADLVSWRALACTTGVDVDELFDVTVAPRGLLAVAVAVLLTRPASTSGWV